MKAAETVLLRNLDNKESKPFAPDHAERLLNYPNTRWAKVAEDEAPKASAAVAKKKLAAAADALPEVDTTGQPTAI